MKPIWYDWRHKYFFLGTYNNTDIWWDHLDPVLNVKLVNQYTDLWWNSRKGKLTNRNEIKKHTRITTEDLKAIDAMIALFKPEN